MKNIDFTSSKVLIIGDVMLDMYYFGKVNRISPEAPVPVVKVKEIKHTLGGAGNVANNIHHLGARPYLIAATGDDQYRKTLENLLQDINTEYDLINLNMPTIAKLRIVGENQQMVRLDFEEINFIDAETVKIFIKSQSKYLDEINVIVISDYGKGVCSYEYCQSIIDTARKNDKFVIIDPKGNDWEKYTGASIITPNLSELSAVAGAEIANNDNDVEKFGKEILKKYKLDYLLVTRSEKGISLFTYDKVYHIPTEAKDVHDVTGAGDTVVATLAVCLACGINIISAIEIANVAAGIVVSKFGTHPIAYNELHYALNILEDAKTIPLPLVEKIVKNLRSQDKKIVFTNGCFDILHRGHVNYLRAAKHHGDILILGLNSDDSVTRLKGKDRPINTQDNRAEVLAALEFIDYIVIFNEDTPYELIKAIKPDVLAKGGDYTVETVVGREFAKRVEIIPFVEGYSSTKTIELLKNS